ncbi:hypothetical protein [Colwellia sp. Arc7-D]|uniref:hypothetical protein n=1 Tax=Colwellia sp. Arc7-D TaxID=2161872 RepID=UPI000D39F72A|nr:hypothetical protein [Colwellia sp. Arc7-D]AWB59186.1 hypothetical protein DBO93_17540 [Colwellia sp. Arc7-D]|tara:strand:+ start:557 stop:1648 length:1092 start_codon:yes stop_codon:yes gene_type:complete
MLGIFKYSYKKLLALVLLAIPFTGVTEQYFDNYQYPTIKVIGFSDIKYDTENKKFKLGQVVAQVISSIDQNSTIFGEIAVTETDSGFESTVERLIFRYDFNDLFKLSVGKFHTPVGYWNATFHHGAWLQTSINRPSSFKFGSAIVPIHFKGLLLEGDFINTDLGLGYRIGYGQGLHQNFARAQVNEHAHQDASVGENATTLQIYSRPRAFPGLNIGLSYFTDTIPVENAAAQTATTITDEIIGLYVALERRNPEIIAEAIQFKHKEKDGDKAETHGNAYYVQIAYRLAKSWQDFQPYARLDKVKIDREDVLIKQDQNYESITGGIRYDFSNYASLKLEYRTEKLGIHKNKNDIAELQLSFVLD